MSTLFSIILKLRGYLKQAKLVFKKPNKQLFDNIQSCPGIERTGRIGGIGV